MHEAIFNYKWTQKPVFDPTKPLMIPLLRQKLSFYQIVFDNVKSSIFFSGELYFL